MFTIHLSHDFMVISLCFFRQPWAAGHLLLFVQDLLGEAAGVTGNDGDLRALGALLPGPKPSRPPGTTGDDRGRRGDFHGHGGTPSSLDRGFQGKSLEMDDD